jgi:hypothetical protein
MWQEVPGSESDEENSGPRTRSQQRYRFQPESTSGSKPRKQVKFETKMRSQSDSTPSSAQEGGGLRETTPDPLSQDQDQGRRSQRLATKPKPDYHEPRIESTREIRTRQQKQRTQLQKK